MARSFNGSTDDCNCGSSVTDLTSNWTVGGWFQRAGSSLSGFDHLWSRWTSSTSQRQLYIYFETTNVIQVDIPFIAAIMTGATAITDANWHHYAVTRSGNNWTLYLGGISDASATNAATQETGAALELFSSTPEAALGAPQVKAFNGDGADVACWDVALTAGEIAAWASGMRPSQIRSANLKGYWPLDGLSSPEPDLSGNAHNGTLTGTSAVAGPPVAMFTPRMPAFLASAAAQATTSYLPLMGCG